ALNEKTDALIALNSLISDNSIFSNDCYLLRADIFYDYGQWNLAKNDYSMYLDFYPKQADVYYKTGMCWLNLRMTEKACYNLKKAVQLRYVKAQRKYYDNCE
ncbi:MAG: hypothetical protein LBV69_06940, partial [Bacteroidales bacterium]|nr:hypothetical protein [Bacteroidales bacterium]